jgi:hypothetical protein
VPLALILNCCLCECFGRERQGNKENIKTGPSSGLAQKSGGARLCYNFMVCISTYSYNASVVGVAVGLIVHLLHLCMQTAGVNTHTGGDNQGVCVMWSGMYVWRMPLRSREALSRWL